MMGETAAAQKALKDALNLYQSAAGLASTYWGFYLTAATVMVGHVGGSSKPPRTGLRAVLVVGFTAFIFSNFSAMVNKQALTFAAAREVVRLGHEGQIQWPDDSAMKRKLSHRCQGVWENLYPAECLHATAPKTVAGFHAVGDVLVLMAILTLNRSPRGLAAA